MNQNELIQKAKLVAAILTDNGHPVTPPDGRPLDNVELARWNVCIELVQVLDTWKPTRLKRYKHTDPIPESILEILSEQYPLCPRCRGKETIDLVSYYERRWVCSYCMWQSEPLKTKEGATK